MGLDVIPVSKGGIRSGRPAALLLALTVAISACVWAPYAPRDHNKLGPPGESQPVPGADSNPLDTPRREPVVCTPQGDPIVETGETRACRADPDCRLVCASAEESLEPR